MADRIGNTGGARRFDGEENAQSAEPQNSQPAVVPRSRGAADPRLANLARLSGWPELHNVVREGAALLALRAGFSRDGLERDLGGGFSADELAARLASMHLNPSLDMNEQFAEGAQQLARRLGGTPRQIVDAYHTVPGPDAVFTQPEELWNPMFRVPASPLRSPENAPEGYHHALPDSGNFDPASFSLPLAPQGSAGGRPYGPSDQQPSVPPARSTGASLPVASTSRASSSQAPVEQSVLESEAYRSLNHNHEASVRGFFSRINEREFRLMDEDQKMEVIQDYAKSNYMLEALTTGLRRLGVLGRTRLSNAERPPEEKALLNQFPERSRYRNTLGGFLSFLRKEGVPIARFKDMSEHDRQRYIDQHCRTAGRGGRALNSLSRVELQRALYIVGHGGTYRPASGVSGS